MSHISELVEAPNYLHPESLSILPSEQGGHLTQQWLALNPALAGAAILANRQPIPEAVLDQAATELLAGVTIREAKANLERTLALDPATADIPKSTVNKFMRDVGFAPGPTDQDLGDFALVEIGEVSLRVLKSAWQVGNYEYYQTVVDMSLYKGKRYALVRGDRSGWMSALLNQELKRREVEIARVLARVAAPDELELGQTVYVVEYTKTLQKPGCPLWTVVCVESDDAIHLIRHTACGEIASEVVPSRLIQID